MGTIVTLRNDNLTASTKTGNLLAATDLQQMPFDGVVKLYIVSSASGVNVEAGVGSAKVITDREIIAIGTTLSTQDHLLAEFDAPAGANLSMFYRETAAAGTTDVIARVEAYSYDEL